MRITRRQAVEAIELHQMLADQPYISEAEAREILRCDLGRGGLKTRPVVVELDSNPLSLPVISKTSFH